MRASTLRWLSVDVIDATKTTCPTPATVSPLPRRRDDGRRTRAPRLPLPFSGDRAVEPSRRHRARNRPIARRLSLGERRGLRASPFHAGVSKRHTTLLLL